MTVLSALDSAGRPRSPATLPGYHAGRPPRNKGMRYPADPPTVEEIVAVMRDAGDDRHGWRLRAMIVVLWRAGLRVQEALALTEHEQPAVSRSFVEPREEPVECDPLSVACEARSIARRSRSESLLKRLPKRRSVAVPHAVRSVRRRSTNVRTRLDRSAAAARMRRGVVSPRSSAC